MSLLGPMGPEEVLAKVAGTRSLELESGAVGVAAAGVNAHKAPSGQHVLFLLLPTLVPVSGLSGLCNFDPTLGTREWLAQDCIKQGRLQNLPSYGLQPPLSGTHWRASKAPGGKHCRESL